MPVSYFDILVSGLRPSYWTVGMPDVCFMSILSIAMVCAIGGCILLGVMAYVAPVGEYWHTRLLILTLVHAAAQTPGMYLVASRPDDQQLAVRVALGLLVGIFLYYTLGALFISRVGRRSRSQNPRHLST